MSLLPFPEKIDVRKFFSRHVNFNTNLPLSAFSRLSEFIRPGAEIDSSELKVELNYIVDEEGRFLISGRMNGLVDLTCQRCLQGVEHKLSTEFKVQILDELEEGGDRELAEDELDVALAQEGQLDLLGLLEDELILSLPLVAYHDELNCNEALVALKASAQNKPSPFAELETLKVQMREGRKQGTSEKK
tara:strand:+ start:239987 stop:240553 length:567 start_codon:yes stop_codon:yes gene_type:complete